MRVARWLVIVVAVTLICLLLAILGFKPMLSLMMQTEWSEELAYKALDVRAHVNQQVFIAPFTPIVENRSGAPVVIEGDESTVPIENAMRRKAVLLGAPKPPTVRTIRAYDARTGELIFCRTYSTERRTVHPEVTVERGYFDCGDLL